LDEYSFLADLLSTFRSVNDWVKFVIVAGFYGTIVGAIGLMLLWRRPKRGDMTHQPQNDTPTPAEPDYKLLSRDVELRRANEARKSLNLSLMRDPDKSV